MLETDQVQSDATEIVDQSATEQPEQVTVNRTAEELAKRLKEVSLEAKQNRQKLPILSANSKRKIRAS